MPDPAIIAHMQNYPEVMDAFDELAGRFGQSLICVFPEADSGLPTDELIVAYPSREPLAVIHTDGTIQMLTEGA